MRLGTLKFWLRLKCLLGLHGGMTDLGWQLASMQVTYLRERLAEARETLAKAEAERDALRQALRDCAILPPSGGGDASDWFQCGLCSAVWRTRESHRSDCLLALAQEKGE